MPEQPDRELLDRFRAERDAAALECLIRRHADFVFGVCSRVLRNRHDAEDAFQATFLILVSRPPRLRRCSSLAGWLFRVAHRTAMRVARQRRRLVELDELMAPAPEPFEEIYQQESVLALDEELSALPERYRAPLVLCSLLGKSRREAASELGRSEASVKASLVRGKNLLRTRLLRRGILLSVAAAAGKQFIPSPVCASEQLVQLTGSLCQGGSVAPGAGPQPAPEIQSLANAGVREMTSAFSAKLTATAVAATVVAGGVLAASIESPKPASAAGPLETTLADTSDDGLVAYEPPVVRGNPNPLTDPNPFAETTVEPLPAAQDDSVAQPGPAPLDSQPVQVPVVSAGRQEVVVQGFPSQQLIQQRAVEYERTRDDALIDIDYQRAMAEAMQLKAEAKQTEAQAMRADNEEQETLLNRSREQFALAESREFEAEAARLTAEADLLERRLTSLGAPFRDEPEASRSGIIELGDQLTIRLVPDPDGIWGTRELTVSPEGSITLPYVGEQPVAGLEFREFVEKLVKYYTAGNVFDDPVFEVNHSRPESVPQPMLEPATYEFPPESSRFSNPEPETVDPPAVNYSDPYPSNADAPSDPNEEADFEPLPIDDLAPTN